MAVAGILATALTNHAAHFAMLTIGGVDVLLQPTAGAASGFLYGVDIESITATEAAPGGVSSLTFTLDDPLSQVTLSRNLPVYFSKTAETYPVFQGFLTSWVPMHGNAGSGRSVQIRCTGLEAVLDWAKLPAMTIPALTYGMDAIAMVAAQCVNGLAFPIMVAAGGDVHGSLTQPLGVENQIGTTALTITAGTTLREAIRQIQDDSAATIGSPNNYFCTVDSGGRLRGFINWLVTPGDFKGPSDWTEIYVENDSAAPANGDGLAINTPMVAQNFSFEVDATTPSSVYVVGAGVTALVSDQTGTLGDTATLSDSTLDTVARCILAGNAYLGQNYVQPRGHFTVDSRAPISGLRAGTTFFIQDTVMGLANTTRVRLTEIQRTFHGTLEDWQITFGGGGPASLTSYLRRLTRSTLS